MKSVKVDNKTISIQDLEELKSKIEVENKNSNEKKFLKRISEGVYKVLTRYHG